MREIIPTQPIPAGPRPRPLATALDSRVGETELTRLDGSAATAVDFFADTWTDAVIVLRESEIVDERYFGDLTPTTPDLLMSVTKSVVGCVAGILAGQGKLDPEAPSRSTSRGRGLRVRRGHGASPARHAHGRGLPEGLRRADVVEVAPPTTTQTSRRPWEPGGPRGFVRDRPEAPGRTGRHDLGPR